MSNDNTDVTVETDIAGLNSRPTTGVDNWQTTREKIAAQGQPEIINNFKKNCQYN